MSQIPVLIPTTLLLTALVGLLAGLRSVKAGHRVAVLGAGVTFVIALAGIREVVLTGEAVRYALGGWVPPIGIELVLDHLSAYLTGIITFIGLVVIVYAPRSLRFEAPGKETFAYPAMTLLLAGLVGMTLTGDVFNLYVFLEISALAAYALLAIGDRAAPLAAFRYLLIGAVGGGFYLLGVGFLYFTAGTLNMADLHARLPELVENRAVIGAAVLMVMGLGLKMALFPLHSWLPDVYQNAPSSSAGLIAPIMTKVSAYAIIRLFLDVFPAGFFTETIPIAQTVGWLSAVGIIFGSVLAIAQQDFRRMLAYSSVGQIAYVGLGIGLANPIGLIGGLLHILNHALMKGLLFLIGGAVRLRTGTVRISEMAGVGRKMPWTMAAFTVGALAMVGIPPAAGFFSKWYLLLGTIEAGNWWWFAVIILSSLLSAVYFFRVLEIVYRDPATEPALEPAATAPRGSAPDSLPDEPFATDPRAGVAGFPPDGEVAPADAGAEGLAAGKGVAVSETARVGVQKRAREAAAPGASGRPAAPVGADARTEAPASMLVPILVLAIAILVVGIFNVLIVNALLVPAVAPLGG